MADTTLTNRILADLATSFADVQKDIIDAKKAIEAAGVPASGVTKNLSEEIAKIQSKVTETIKSSTEIDGLANGTLSLRGGFIFDESSIVNKMTKVNTVARDLQVDYYIPDNKQYLYKWPNPDYMRDLYNAFHEAKSKPNVSEKIKNLDEPLLRLHFTKRNLPYLINTGKFALNTDFPVKNSYNNSIPIEVHLHLDENDFDMDGTVSQEMIDKYKFTDRYGSSSLRAGAKIINIHGNDMVSLPYSGSKLFINDTEIGEDGALLTTYTFIPTSHDRVKAVLCYRLVIDMDTLINDGAENPIKVYIREDAPALDIDFESARYLADNSGYIGAKYIYAFGSEPLLKIHVKKSEQMDNSIRRKTEYLMAKNIQILTYDESEVFDYDSGTWKRSYNVNWSDLIKLTSNNTASIDRIFFGDLYGGVTPAQKLFDEIYIGGDKPIDRISPDMILDYAETIKSYGILTVDSNSYGIGNSNNTRIFAREDKTWTPQKPLDFKSLSSPLNSFFYSMDTDSGAIKALTFNMTNISHNNDQFNNPMQFIGIIDGYYEATKEYHIILPVYSENADMYIANYLAKPNMVKLYNRDKNLITKLKFDSGTTDVDSLTSCVPVWYSKDIREVELTNCKFNILPELTNTNLGKIIGYADEANMPNPDSPMIYKLHNCKLGSITHGINKLRNNTKFILTPNTAKVNAKYVRFLIEETDPIVEDVEAIASRFDFYNMDQTKRYNYSSQTWEPVDSITSDEKQFSEIVTGEKYNNFVTAYNYQNI